MNAVYVHLLARDPIRQQRFIWIFVLLFTCALIIGGIVHNRIRGKLKNGETTSLKTKGIIKSIECTRGGRSGTGDVINGRYISVEAIDPFTKQKKIYESEQFDWPHNVRRSIFSSFKKNKDEFDKYIVKQVAVGDPAEVVINKKNPKVYYIPEPVK